MTSKRLIVAILWLVTGCVSGLPQERSAYLKALRGQAAKGNPEAARDLASEIAAHGQPTGSLAEARRLASLAARSNLPRAIGWAARLAEAAGDTRGAFDDWLRLVQSSLSAPDWLRHYASVRLVQLVDKVSLTNQDLKRLHVGMQGHGSHTWILAEALEIAAKRKRVRTLLADARLKMGVVKTYKRTNRLHALPIDGLNRIPAQAFSSQGDTTTLTPQLSQAILTPDGTLSFPEDGPGVYAVQIALPHKRKAKQLVCVGIEAGRLLMGGKEIARTNGISSLAPKRIHWKLPSANQSSLVILIASQTDSPQIKCMLQGRVRPPAAPAKQSLLSNLAALELSLWSGDIARANQQVENLFKTSQWAPLLAVPAVRLWRSDPTLSISQSRAQSERVLRRAMSRLPQLEEARIFLASERLDSSAPREADKLLTRRLPKVDRLILQVQIADELQDRHVTESLSRKLVELIPTSCPAWKRYLDVNWMQLQLRSKISLDNLPGCFSLQLNGIRLLHEGWRLGKAIEAVKLLKRDARPGRERASLALRTAKIHIAKGKFDLAEKAVRQGLKEDVLRGPLLALGVRIARLQNDPVKAQQLISTIRQLKRDPTGVRRKFLDPKRDLGLPLTNGHRVVLEANKTKDTNRRARSAEILLHEHHTRIFPDGTMVHRVHRMIGLYDRQAVEDLGEISVPAGAEILIARTWKPTSDGKFQPISAEDMAEKEAISLPALKQGAIAEIAYYWVQNPDFRLEPAWKTPSFYFDSLQGHTHTARYLLRLPPGLKPRIHLTGRQPIITQPKADLTSYTLTQVPRFVSEPLELRPLRRRAAIQVTTLNSWKAYRQIFMERMRQPLRVTPHLKKTVRQWVGKTPTKNPDRTLRKLYEGVIKQIPDGSQPVLKTVASLAVSRRVGDRSVLLTSLCRAAGLKCSLALVRPRLRGPFKISDPVTTQDFVYPVVIAHRASGDTWLSPSNRFTPYGYLPPLIQGCEAMVLNDKKARIKTPLFPRKNGNQSAKWVVRVKSNGSYRATATLTLTGFAGISWRNALNGYTQAQRQKALKRYLGRQLRAFKVSDVSLSHLDRREKPLTITFSGQGRLSRIHQTQMALDGPLLATALTPRLTPMSSRVTPIQNNQWVDTRIELSVHMPNGFRLKQLPPRVHLIHTLAEFEQEATLSQTDRKVTLKQRLHLDVGHVLPSDYRRWVAVAQRIDREQKINLRFETR